VKSVLKTGKENGTLIELMIILPVGRQGLIMIGDRSVIILSNHNNQRSFCGLPLNFSGPHERNPKLQTTNLKQFCELSPPTSIFFNNFLNIF
jgi:hypothetical protein